MVKKIADQEEEEEQTQRQTDRQLRNDQQHDEMRTGKKDKIVGLGLGVC